VEAARRKLEDLRSRLIDLTGRNPFLNFRRRADARTQLQIFDASPDQIFARLVANRASARLRPLPEPPDAPTDEDAPVFQDALAAAQATDAEYLAAIAAHSDGDRDKRARASALRDLKDRVRAALGMTPWTHGREMPLAEWARRNGVDPSPDLAPPGDFDDAARRPAGDLQTLRFADDLARNARALMAEARRWREEKGVDALHLALGFLEWREGGADSPLRLAPLLLAPVEIAGKATLAGPRFDVGAGAGEVQTNAALALKLRQDFGLALPGFGEADDADAATPEAYFASVERMAEARPGWRVRRFAIFAPFTFGALAIHRDLDPANWEERPLAEHPLIAGLLGGRSAPADGNAAEPTARLEDRSATPAPLVLDADASQYAIVHAAAVDGEDLAVQGPPGTGKSQTIVNLIAAALSQGKRVLFVAEKSAALDVVAKRLADVGLGAFCLDLHGAGARREEVLAALKQRIDAPAPAADPARLAQALAEARRLKQSLTHYAASMNRPFGALGLSLHDLIWREQATWAFDLPAGVDDILMAAAEATTPYGAAATRQAAADLATTDRAFREAHGSPARAPWRALGDARPSGLARRRLLELMANWRDAAGALGAAGESWRRADVEPPQSPDALERAKDAAGALPPAPENLAADVFPSLAAPSQRSDLAGYLDDAAARAAAKAMMAQAFASEVAALAADDLPSYAAGLEAIVGDGSVGDLAAAAEMRVAEAAQWEALAERARSFIGDIGVEGVGGHATVGALRRALVTADALAALNPAATPWRRIVAADQAAAAAGRAAADRSDELAKALDELARRHGIDLDRLGDLASMRRDATALAAAGFWKRLFGREHRAAMNRLKAAGLPKKANAARALSEALATRAEIDALAEDDALRLALGSAFAGMATDAAGLRAAADFGDRVRAEFAGLAPAAIAARAALFEADDARFEAMRLAARGDLAATLRAVMAEIEGEADATLLKDLPQRARDNASHVEGLRRRAAEIQAKPTATAAGLRAVAAARTALAEAERRMGARREFGGLNPDLPALEATQAFAAAVAAILAPAPALLEAAFAEDYAAARARLQAAGAETRTALDEEANARGALAGAGFDADLLFDGGAEGASPRALGDAAGAALLAGEPALAAWIERRRPRSDAAEAGLGALIAAFETADRPFDDLAHAYDRALARSLIAAAFAAEPALAAHRGARADGLRARFQALDREIMTRQADLIRATLAAAAVPAGNAVGRVGDKTEKALIEHYAGQKRPRIPLRALFARAPRAIQALKPCLMLSPATVAEVLTPGAMAFDLLVIDEASQMTPEYALGALARSKQAVIVGDEMQLPPTDFFASAYRGADEEMDGDAEERVAHESILGLANAAFRPERRLAWHYRSRHESLIQFSNQQFYDDGLIVFPAARAAAPGRLGVSLRPVEGARYVAGRRVNPDEADAIVEAAVARMHADPSRSIGVVAMNIAQRDLIEDRFNRVADADEAVQAYLERWRADGLDPFFIKNLETVQGDERDVILISATYGPDAKTGVVMQRFGPINGRNGHRRLNVLFTRAREETQLFASLTARDVRVDGSSAAGLKAFHDFLAYAATGRLPETRVGAPENHESPFEATVAAALAAAGFQTTPQVGVAGYRIDLGVTHPDFPHGYVAGVECDGAAYHSAAAARDRDRLRQEALERLGWTIIRIWSTDWFDDPAGQSARLAEKVESAARDAVAGAGSLG